MSIAEHATVRLRRALTADDGRVLDAGCEAVVVDVGCDQNGEVIGYMVEAFIKNSSLRAGGSFHLADAEPSDIELAGDSSN